HEFVIPNAAHREDLERGYQNTVLVIVRSLIIKRETTVGIVSLFRNFLLDPEERVNEAGPCRLLIGVSKFRAVDRGTRSRRSQIIRWVDWSWSRRWRSR